MSLITFNFDGDLICRTGRALLDGCRSIRNVSKRYRRDKNVKSILKALASTESGSISVKSIDVEGVPWPLLRAAVVRNELTDDLVTACLQSEEAWSVRDAAFAEKSKFARGALTDTVERLQSGVAYKDINVLSEKICSAEFYEVYDTEEMRTFREHCRRRFGSKPDLAVGDMALIKAMENAYHHTELKNVELSSAGIPIFVGETFGDRAMVRWEPHVGAVFSCKNRRVLLNWDPDSSWNKVRSRLKDDNVDWAVTRGIFDRLVRTEPKFISTSQEIDILYLLKEVLEHRDFYAEDGDAICDALFDQLTLNSKFKITVSSITGSRWMSLSMEDRRKEVVTGALSPEAKEKVEVRPDKVMDLIRGSLRQNQASSEIQWGMHLFDSSGARNAEEVLRMHNLYLENCKPNKDMRVKQRGMHLSVLAARRMYHPTFGTKENEVRLTYGLEKTVSQRSPTRTDFKDVVLMYAPGSVSAYVYILGEETLSELKDTKRQPLAGVNPSMLASARLLLSLATQRSDSAQLVDDGEKYLSSSISAIFTLHDHLFPKMYSTAREVVKLSDINSEAIRLFGDTDKARWVIVEVMSMLAVAGSVDSGNTIGKSCLYDCLSKICGNITATVAKVDLNHIPDLSYVEVMEANGQKYITLDTEPKQALILSGLEDHLTEAQARVKVYHLTVGMRPNEQDGVRRMKFRNLRVGC